MEKRDRKRIKTGMFTHKILTKLNDAQLNRIADIVSKSKTTALIKKLGDIDYPSSLIKKFFSISLKQKETISLSLDSLS